MIHQTLAALVIPLGSVQRYPGNPRTHNLDVLRSSLRRNGQYRPIVVNRRTMQILAGNGTHEAAEQEGWTEIAATLVDVDEEEAARIVAVDNRASDLGGYDDTALLAILEGLPDLEGTGYDQDALDALEALVRPAGGGAALTDPDAIPEPPAEPITRPGDLWLLGPHRLLCGDATVAEDVARLMAGERDALLVTDPPYGVDYGELVASRVNQKQGGWRPIEGDDLSDDELLSLLTAAIASSEATVAFVWHPPGARRRLFWQALEANGWRVAQEIVWVKDTFVFGRADYHWRHEPCLYAKRKGAPPQDDRTQSTVWEVPKITGAEHPTQKPVELYARAIRNHTHPGDIAYEPFAGSGSGIIAAHALDRRCYAVELDPVYVDVACRRYQEHTDTKPVLERTGEPHDFTE